MCVFSGIMSSCASYRWGNGDRTIPGGYKTVFIPMFKNYSLEPGIEVYYTDALRREFERSEIATVTGSGESEVELRGEIKSLTYTAAIPLTGSNQPTGTVLAGTNDIHIEVKLSLIRRIDKKVLWEKGFVGLRTYSSPQVFAAGINSVDPLYNQSARRQNIQTLSQTMMAEAHDRISEGF
jgi:hypothetical protein